MHLLQILLDFSTRFEYLEKLQQISMYSLIRIIFIQIEVKSFHSFSQQKKKLRLLNQIYGYV